jgi:hypothetical protein
MIVLYIFLIGCAVTGIVTLGVVFALAAAGYGETPAPSGKHFINHKERKTLDVRPR